MKKTLKGYLLGFLSSAVLLTGLTGVAYAANTTTLYDVINEGIKIVLDGKELVPTDVNGKRVQPMVYEGTTYLPVRAIAGALGKAVYWDGPNFTVYLGDMDGKLEYPTVSLSEAEDMVTESYNFTSTNLLIDNYNNNYGDAYCDLKNTSERPEGSIQYFLQMKYSKLRGTLYIPKGMQDNGSEGIVVKADGKTVYTSPAMDKFSKPEPFDVDITGCNVLEIEFNGENRHMVHIGDAGFYQ